LSLQELARTQLVFSGLKSRPWYWLYTRWPLIWVNENSCILWI